MNNTPRKSTPAPVERSGARREREVLYLVNTRSIACKLHSKGTKLTRTLTTNTASEKLYNLPPKATQPLPTEDVSLGSKTVLRKRLWWFCGVW